MVQKRSLSESLAHFVRCMCADHRVGDLARACLMSKRAIHKKCAKGIDADSFTATQALRLAQLERDTYGTTSLRDAIMSKLMAGLIAAFCFTAPIDDIVRVRRGRSRREEQVVAA